MSGKVNVLFAVRDGHVPLAVLDELDDEASCILSMAAGGKAVLACVEHQIPDILLLDALLPDIDGLGVMDCLHAMLGERMPRVIGGSMMPFCDEGFIRRGAAAVVRVPWEYEQLRRVLCEQMQALDEEFDWDGAKEVYAHAAQLLAQMGMHSGLKGYAYLSWSAVLAYEREERLHAVGEMIYAPIARHFATTQQSVERLIRHAVERTMDEAKPGGVYDFFGNTIDPMRGKPTNLQVIAALVQRMRVEKKAAI